MSKYSLETKIKAVHDVLKLGMSSSAVAKLLSTANAVIQRWVARGYNLLAPYPFSSYLLI